MFNVIVCQIVGIIWKCYLSQCTLYSINCIILYTKRDSPPSASFHCYGAVKRQPYDGISILICRRFHDNWMCKPCTEIRILTFSVKPKWRVVVFGFFAARSSAEAHLRTSPPRGHSMVGVPRRCGGFVAIWLRAREEYVDNRIQLLLI